MGSQSNSFRKEDDSFLKFYLQSREEKTRFYNASVIEKNGHSFLNTYNSFTLESLHKLRANGLQVRVWIKID